MGEETNGRKAKWTLPLSGFFLSSFFVLAIHVPWSWAAEKTYPNRPINMIVAFAPGGGADLGSKVLGDNVQDIVYSKNGHDIVNSKF